jgi:thymidine kinase
MADLTFYYGPMGCSKTANALMARHNALSLNQKVWLIKPAIDTRDDKILKDGTRQTIVRSRVGIEAEAQAIGPREHICPPPYTCLIICDEAQFLQSWQVDELNEFAKDFDIPVLCYGLKTDFKTNFFLGSARLFEIADRLIELETFCECGKKAVLTAKFVDGEIVTSGKQVDIGGDEKYKAMCYVCWRNAKLKKELNLE